MTSTPISTNELSAMRSEVESTLTVPYVAQTSTNISDGAGGVASTWTTSSSGLCLISPINQPSKSTFADRIGSRQAWTVIVAYGSDVLPTDRLQIGATIYQTIGTIPRLTYLQVVCVSVT